MTKTEKIVIGSTLLLIALMAAVPPWRGKRGLSPSVDYAMGYRFIADTPTYSDDWTFAGHKVKGHAYRIDTDRLYAQILAVACLGASVVLILRGLAVTKKG